MPINFDKLSFTCLLNEIIVGRAIGVFQQQIVDDGPNPKGEVWNKVYPNYMSTESRKQETSSYTKSINVHCRKWYTREFSETVVKCSDKSVIQRKKNNNKVSLFTGGHLILLKLNNTGY